MKRILKISLCVLMTLVMSFGMSLNVYAANANKLYVSDVITFEADSYEDAKKGLEKMGYEIAGNVNLNATLKTGIYLGYKTTENKDEAITDLATMNMLGGYSYSDYETILENQRDTISQGINAILPAIENYQYALAEESNEGLLVKAMLNVYEDDDSGDLMGDYLEDYDFTDDALSDLTEILLQANSGIVYNIMKALAITADENSTTILERLKEVGLGGAFDEYKATNKGKNAEKDFRREYSDTVLALQSDWDNLASTLSDAAGKVILSTDGTYSLTDEAASISIDDYVLYIQLSSLNDSSIREFFLSNYDKEMYEDMYSVAYVMTDSQKGLLTYLSPLAIFEADAVSYENLSQDELNEAIEELEELDTLSVYEGVDRTIYDEGVAFTSAATAHESLSGTPWYATSEAQDVYCKIMLYGTSAALVAGIAAMSMVLVAKSHVSAIKSSCKAYNKTLQKTLSSSVRSGELFLWEAEYEFATLSTKYKSGLLTRVRIERLIGLAAFVLFIIFVILDVISIITYFATKDKVYEEQIPYHLVTAADVDGETKYIYYTAVENQDGDEADLNNHEGDPSTGWLVLYYTKDAGAGEPLQADSFKMIQGSNDAPEGYDCIHMFNQTSPVNTTAYTYTSVSDEVGGTYVYYKSGEYTNSAVGTVAVSPTQTILVGLCSIIVGVFLGTIMRKKIKEA